MTARRPRARAVATALLLALATALGGSLPPLEPVTAPVARTLPAPVRDALRPLPVFAGTPCSNYSADYPKFTGRLSNSSGTLLTETTTGTVYGRINNVDQSWDLYDCYAYRYDAVVWATTNATTNLTVDWGLLAGDGNACRYDVGSTDYLHANSGACPGSETTARLVVSLSPEAVYHQDVDLDTKGDFAFAHADCYTEYDAEEIKTGASTSVTSGRPGANCGNKALDGTGTTQTLVYDATPPTISISAPAAGGPAVVTSAAYTVTFKAEDTVAGFGGSDDWELRRQIAPATGPTACGTFVADTAPGALVTGTTSSSSNQTSAQTLASGSCYRWTLTATDRNGNTAATVTSGSVRRSVDTLLGLPAWGRFETWDLGAGDGLAINVATGNAVVSHPIVSLPIRGSSASLALTYNSQDPVNVGFGPGWRLNLGRRLVLNADLTVTFIGPDGGRATFTNPVGSPTTYTRPAGLYADLVKNGTTYTLTYRDLARDTYATQGSEGILTREEDRFGNGVTLAYVAGTTRISTITDTAASPVRTISFGYDASSRPTSITDWAYVNNLGVVQASVSGSLRKSCFFYDASNRLTGWTDPLYDPTNPCPASRPTASHATGLTYSTDGLLTAIGRTQTYTTLTSGVIGSATRPISTQIAYLGGDVTTVKNAEEVNAGSAGTAFTRPAAGTVQVVRRGNGTASLDTTTQYLLVAANDALALVGSIKRKLGTPWIEQRTTYDASFTTEPATVVDNYVNGTVGDGSRDVEDHTISYTYGSFGLVSRITEPLGFDPITGVFITRTTDYTYNANNDVTQVTVSEKVGAVETVRELNRSCYTTSGCSTSATDLLLRATIDNYVDGSAGGANGHTDDVTTTYQYDAYGQRIRETRSNYAAGGALLDQAATGWTYDAHGNVTSEIRNHADGAVDNPGTDITPDGTTNARTDLTTAFGYDSAGNRTSSADPRRAIDAAKGTTLADDDYVARTTYDALGAPVTTRLPTTPTASGGTDCSPSPGCRETATEYDELGLGRAAADINDLVTATLYDRVGRPLETYEDPAGAPPAARTSVSTYDAQGRLLTAKDRRQVADSSLGATVTEYDELGRATKATEASGTAAASPTATAYDNLDRVTCVQDGWTSGACTAASSGQTTLTTYDIGGRVISVDDEFTCTTTAYDWRDLPTQVVEGRTPGSPCSGTGTRTVNAAYDALGRLTARTVAGGGDTLEAATFDAAGRATRTWSTTGTTSQVTETTWNALDEAVTESRFAETDGVRSSETWARANRDPAGNVTDRCTWTSAPAELCHLASDPTWPTPAPATRASSRYDARNARVELYTPGLGATTYDPAHNYTISGVYLPTAAGREHQTLYRYDEQHRLERITVRLCATSQRPCSGGNLLWETIADEYLYDANHNRTKVAEDAGAGTVTRYYCHDARDQVVTVATVDGCASGVLETYGYDPAGNRTSAAGRTFTYTSAGQLATCSGTACNPIFDSEGRLTRVTTAASGTWSYLYDAEGRLTSACQSSSCTGTGFARLDMTYDAEGRRVRLAETPAAGTPTVTEFRHEGGRVVAETATTGSVVITRAFTLDEAGVIVKMTIATTGTQNPDDGTYLVTYNGHGDALAIFEIDAQSGTLARANRFSYSTWGAPTLTTEPGYGDLGFRYRYVGQAGVAWDSTPTVPANLLLMGARHYSPELGRFLIPDPSAAEPNLYAYGANSPVSRVDPSGYFVCAVPLIGWALCAAGVRIALWAAGPIAGFIGSILFRSSQAAPVIAARGPLVLNMARDALGRVVSVSSTLTPAAVRTGTAASAAARTWVGNQGAIYQAGHLIARVFGGPGGLRSGNIVAMLNTLNNTQYRVLEVRLLRIVEAGNRVQVHVQPFYSGASPVPYKIVYWYKINNLPWVPTQFYNR